MKKAKGMAVQNHYFPELEGIIPEEYWKQLEERINELLSETKDNAFMQGYCYAIQILVDSVSKKNPQ